MVYNISNGDNMNQMIPNKLKRGDMVRMIAPSHSYAIDGSEQREIARKRFEDELGLRISFGKHVEEIDEMDSSSVASRLEDLHEAFADPRVKGIVAIEGGFNSNQLLGEIDWELIRNNPKVFCGYSDVTVLNNAFLAKTGLVSYNGPMFSTFGMKKHYEYNLEYFRKCVMEEGVYDIKVSDFWSDDDWETDQENRKIIPNEGNWIVKTGEAQGRIIGGNLSSLVLLQGTDYWPGLEGAILFLEEDYEWGLHHVDRVWQGIMQLPDFKEVKGIVIGRFQNDSKVERSRLEELLRNKKEIGDIPVIANIDFGHANPKATIPIGGSAYIGAFGSKTIIKILTH